MRNSSDSLKDEDIIKLLESNVNEQGNRLITIIENNSEGLNNKLNFDEQSSSSLLEEDEREIPSSNEDIIVLKGMKRQRKSKKETNGRTYICNLCMKSYLSYPALYTHKRNKHNIIPITGKPDIFKTGSNVTPYTRFKYNVLDSNLNNKRNIEPIIRSYVNIYKSYYSNSDSIFYRPDYDLKSNSFLKILYNLNASPYQIYIPKPEDKDKNRVDYVLAVYIILLTEVTREKMFSEIIIKFVFLFREFLNLVGWDHFKFLQEYGLLKDLIFSGEFCANSDCEEIPEMVNDFVAVFLEIEDKYPNDKKEILDITQNFCYWLFINGFTCYKVSRCELVT